MAKHGLLEKQWEELMRLCHKETDLRRSGRHPKVLRLVSERIEQLAEEMGFTARQISTREFRAERDGDRIVRIDTT